MSELNKIAGTPQRIKLQGKEYTASPLTISDLAEFEMVVKKMRNEDAREGLKGAGLSEEIVAKKIVELSNKPITNEDLTTAMNSMTGAKYLIWYALRRNHPDLKLEDVGRLITLENFGEVMNIAYSLGGTVIGDAKKKVERGKK